jgi:hypothetical protein
MTLKVVGAGLGRTGTHSLKIALEQLLGAPCYHMLEVFEHPEHVPEWHRAIQGETPNWATIFAGYAAAVDWPTGAFYEPLSAVYADAIVVLSRREDAEAWWRSYSKTIAEAIGRLVDSGGHIAGGEGEEATPLDAMLIDLLSMRFTPGWREHDAAIAAYQRHNDEVRARVPAGRLVEWQPADGWAPLCAGLGLAVPAEPFPHVNSTAEFRAMTGLDSPT